MHRDQAEFIESPPWAISQRGLILKMFLEELGKQNIPGLSGSEYWDRKSIRSELNPRVDALSTEFKDH